MSWSFISGQGGHFACVQVIKKKYNDGWGGVKKIWMINVCLMAQIYFVGKAHWHLATSKDDIVLVCGMYVEA